MSLAPLATSADEWVWGWDPTPGIVSVWAEASGRVDVWRRLPVTRELVHEEARFRPWALLASLEDLAHVGHRLHREREGRHGLLYRELEGDGALRFLVSADDFDALSDAVVEGATRRLGRRVPRLGSLPPEQALVLPLEEQYLVATGRTSFRGLEHDDLRRLQLDLETTGLDPEEHRVFLVAVRDPEGRTVTLEARGEAPEDEADLIARVAAHVRAADPDVVENHNLHGFDLPFLWRRVHRLGVPFEIGRLPGGLVPRFARRGGPAEGGGEARIRYSAPGRELVDTLDAVRTHDFATRELPSHGLKDVARHFGFAEADREYVPGARVFETWRRDPARVRRYASQDVAEVAELARLLGGAAFALARMAPRRYERLADAGPATGVIDPMLVRAYVRAGRALPAPAVGDGTPHTGAALHLFAAGVAERVVKADVASLYPSLMRQYRIGPAGDELGALLALVDRLVTLRLDAKAKGRAAPAGSAERWGHEAMSAAMKLVVNSAYGYLAAIGLVRFSDVHAANEVTRRGRALLALLCRELAVRGTTLLEADTDGVYFAMPAGSTEVDERRIVAEVGALLPPLVKLEHDGRYAAMLSHEPKNYALLGYDGHVERKGVAFRSSRAEPFGQAFLDRALERLLRGDVDGVREAYVATALALRRREVATRDVATLVRLTKTPEDYHAVRAARREAAYEALLSAGRDDWAPGERVRVYRDARGRPRLAPGDDDASSEDRRDYDAEHYVRMLKGTFAARLARALAPDDYAAGGAGAAQGARVERSLVNARPVLTRVMDVDELADEPPPA